MGSDRQRVLFLHPDLGIGGAERLIVDAAVCLQRKGYDVNIVTSHHDSKHCFKETIDGTLTVNVIGDWLPRSTFSRGMVVWAMIRSLWSAFVVFLNWYREPYDVVIIDQVSISIPIFKLTNSKVLYYCHFPDMLLSPRNSMIKRVYRLIPDAIEQMTTGMSDKVLVNSKFTMSVFYETFQWLSHMQVDVLYPAIDFSQYDNDYIRDNTTSPLYDLPLDTMLLLSINRFERKKNIELAILGFRYVLHHIAERRAKAKLVVAGGYDTRVLENVEYNNELEIISKKNSMRVSYYPDMNGDVVFLRSFNEQQRKSLFERCCCVIYTPSNEHFGIVPIEAMYSSRPVIACNSGGPLESVLDGKTGYLCSPDENSFGSAMLRVVLDNLDQNESMIQMKSTARDHVIQHFSFDAFSSSLDTQVIALLKDKRTMGCIFIRSLYIFGALIVLYLVNYLYS